MSTIWYTDSSGNVYFAPSNMPIGDALQNGLVTVNVTQCELDTYEEEK